MTVCSKDRTKLPSLALFLSILLFLVSCRKNEDTIGSDFIEGIVGFDEVSSDTATLVSYTTISDSVATNKLTYYLLGSMNDPEFGTSTASIISQMQLPAEDYHWASATVNIDSIVLQVVFADKSLWYGNRNTPQTINLYELDEALEYKNLSDYTYHSKRNYIKKSTVLGSWNGTFSESLMGDSVTYSYANTTRSYAPHLRIKITDPAFIARMKDADAGNHFKSTSAFQSYIKGLVVVPETNPLPNGEGGIAHINMRKSVTSLVVYYNDSLRADFPMYNESLVWANKYSHTHVPSIALQPANGGAPQTTNYIQPLSGLKMRVLFPNLLDYVKNNHIAVTGAEVIFTADQTRDTTVYKLPSRIRLLASDAEGRSTDIRDFFEGDAYYGGYYNLQTGEYHFNIVRQIQYILSEYKTKGNNVNYGLNLLVQADNPILANRLILDTRPGKIKLKLTYTVIK